MAIERAVVAAADGDGLPLPGEVPVPPKGPDEAKEITIAGEFTPRPKWHVELNNRMSN